MTAKKLKFESITLEGRVVELLVKGKGTQLKKEFRDTVRHMTTKQLLDCCRIPRALFG